jgi:hypothetical protein
MAAKEPAEETPTEETGRPARDGSASPPGASPSPEKPLLMVDIDGVISLFVGFAGHAPWATGPAGPDECRYETIDGIPHCLSRTAAAHLLELTAEFEPVWASGWEEKAEENLPRLLGLPAGLPFLRFERSPGRGNAHWKLAAIDEHAGSRPLAWIDDAFNDSCHAWARARPAPTLLVQTVPEHGLTSREASRLTTWARSLAPPPAAARDSRAPEATPRQ